MYRIQFGKEGLTALLGSLFLRRSLWSSLRAPTQRWRSCSLSASIRTWCLVPGGFSSLVVTYNKTDTYNTRTLLESDEATIQNCLLSRESLTNFNI